MQRQAELHIHDDLIHLEARTNAFLHALPNVRAQVLAEFRVRAESREAGARTPAATTFVLVVGTTATVFAALMVALLGGFFSTLVPLIDPKSAVIHGGSQTQFMDLVWTTVLVVGVVAGLALGAAGVAWARARGRDRERAVYKAWIEVYRGAAGRTNARRRCELAGRR